MSAESQSHYQVRFDWGLRGAAAIAEDADVTVLLDGIAAVESGASVLDADDVPGPGAVLRAGLGGATAAAAYALQLQERLGRRAMIALVAVGGAYADGAPRPAVEDQLAAGSVVDALMALGIDFCSPEAAVAGAGYEGLKRAVAHLSTASVTARLLAEQGRAEEGVADRSSEFVELRAHAELPAR